MAALVETQQLTKVYGERTAVDHLNLTLNEGEIFGLLGPNGAGKTTTILMLLGLTEPTEGTAAVAGLNPQKDALKVKRLVSYLPENVGFYDDISAYGNLAYTAELNRIGRKQAQDLIEEALDEVGLSERAFDKVGTFSRGMRQRLAIADVLIKRPRVAFLDEPTLALDPDGVNQILELILKLRRERGMTILLSSHLLEQVQRICDRIGIFVKGKMVALGGIEELGVQLASNGKGRVVEIGAEPLSDDLIAALKAVKGVKGVERAQKMLLVSSEKELRPELAAAVSGAGSKLLHLRLQTVGLEQIYFRYFKES
ncbi:MAG TPA: ABC transporter ATP-binding protein [Chloroflexota bacterium]|nr:ABC transporter ATP-binding protein [Chloroflexota bacterium]